MGRIKYLMKNTFLFALGSLGSRIVVFLLVPLYTGVLLPESHLYSFVSSSVHISFDISLFVKASFSRITVISARMCQLIGRCQIKTCRSVQFGLPEAQKS